MTKEAFFSLFIPAYLISQTYFTYNILFHYIYIHTHTHTYSIFIYFINLSSLPPSPHRQGTWCLFLFLGILLQVLYHSKEIKMLKLGGVLVFLLIVAMDVAAGILGIQAEVAQNKVHLNYMAK